MESIAIIIEFILKHPEFTGIIIIGFICWLMHKIFEINIQEKRRHYENFKEITDKLGKITNPNHEERLSPTEWIITLYQLQSCKEYSENIIAMLNFLKERPPAALNFMINDVRKAIEQVQNQLLNQNTTPDRLSRRFAHRNDSVDNDNLNQLLDRS